MTRGRAAVVAFTQNVDDLVRIISLRKASRYESEQYAKALQNELEEN